MKRCKIVLFLLVILIALPLAQKIKSEFDHAADFSRYHTCAWAAHIEEMPANGMISNREEFTGMTVSAH